MLSYLSSRSILRPTATRNILVAVAITAVPTLASAEDGKGSFTFILENDLFYNKDRDYTNGVALAWSPANDSPPNWAVDIAHLIPWFPKDEQVHYGFGVGQNMYTPNDISLANPPLNDRPYAGWLYGAAGLGVETDNQLDQLSLTLGMVGPASYAEQTQKFIHHVVGSPQPQGWNNQLGNELGLLITYQRSWRALSPVQLGRLSLDLMPHIGGALGNVYTYGNAGFTVRYGKNLPRDFGPIRIQPSVPGSISFSQSKELGWYFFGGLDARAVARNIFLDGNTFKSSRSVTKEPVVGDFQWGVVISINSVQVSYTHVVRTREFKTQAGSDQFGAISISTVF